MTTGKTVIRLNILNNTFSEAYYWLRTNTAEDATIMSWWDYGYQISGMANRLDRLQEKVTYDYNSEPLLSITIHGITHTSLWLARPWPRTKMMPTPS